MSNRSNNDDNARPVIGGLIGSVVGAVVGSGVLVIHPLVRRFSIVSKLWRW